MNEATIKRILKANGYQIVKETKDEIYFKPNGEQKEANTVFSKSNREFQLKLSVSNGYTNYMEFFSTITKDLIQAYEEVTKKSAKPVVKERRVVRPRSGNQLLRVI